MRSSSRRYWYSLAVPTFGYEEVKEATNVLESCQTTMGERVEEFEEEFSRYVGAEHAVMVNSGSSANLLIAMSSPIEVRLRRLVAVPAVTWPTQVWPWDTSGRWVHFVDADPLNISAETLEKALADRTVHAVHLTHLMGVPCDMDPILEVIGDRLIYEDCCEALGATYDGEHVGSFGEAASWSFFFSHHITTMEGGMVTTNDPDLASSMRSLRSHGWERHKGGDPYTFHTMGFNLRPTEVQAAIGLVQLSRLDQFNKTRWENYLAFWGSLNHPRVTFPVVPGKAKASWFGLPLFVHRDRDRLAEYLEDHGVETRPILGGNLLRQPAFSGWSAGPLPGADWLHDHGLFIGLHPHPDSGIEQVAELINQFE